MDKAHYMPVNRLDTGSLNDMSNSVEVRDGLWRFINVLLLLSEPPIRYLSAAVLASSGYNYTLQQAIG